ncbi:MAG: lysophospholipid acyltransferase family protein [Armatimonadota bacterium]
MIHAIIVYIIRFILKVSFDIKIIGYENLPQKEGVIISANHSSFWDPPTIGSLSTKKVRYMAKAELFKFKPFGWLISFVGAFPVERKSADKGALSKALELLKNNQILCIFPEGTRIKGGKKRKPLPGAAYLSVKAQVPVVPAAIIEDKKIKSLKSRWPFLSKITVNIGNPMYDFKNPDVDPREYTDKIMDEIEKLKTR